MLTDDIERYVEIRRASGYKFVDGAAQVRAYGRFAVARGDTHVTVATALAWAADAVSPLSAHVRMRYVVRLARFLWAEDATHEVPPRNAFFTRERRPLPYIYSNDEVNRLVAAAGRLRQAYPHRREVFSTLIGLIACTGLRVSEALDLHVADVLEGGVLLIRNTKFKKSRLVPLHATAAGALDRYLEVRRRMPIDDPHLFVSAGGTRIGSSMVNWTFHRMLKLADIAPARARRPRIHDLRHTFATRALERCPADRYAISRHVVALSTYLGHANMQATHWYLEATPELMADIAEAAEAAVWGNRS